MKKLFFVLIGLIGGGTIYGAPNDAYAEVEEVITPEGDWIWYGDPDQKPSGARLPRFSAWSLVLWQ